MGTYTNSVDPDKAPQNAASHQGLRCKLLLMITYKKGAFILFVLTGDKSSKGAYEEVIPT